MDLAASIYGLYALLEEFPEDWDSYLVLADALEEDGSELAAGYRWLGRVQKRPQPPDKINTDWFWYDGNDPPTLSDPPSDLPGGVWGMLARKYLPAKRTYRYMQFHQLREALDAAAQAYLDACTAGWKEEVRCGDEE